MMMMMTTMMVVVVVAYLQLSFEFRGAVGDDQTRFWLTSQTNTELVCPIVDHNRLLW